MSMFAKLMSRITQSSLMEEPIEVRYTFMMLLAMADMHGYVIGTDVAIARTLNIELPLFLEAMEHLMAPDPHSNSKEHEGRRVILSDAERGYYLVNYTKYRDTRDEEQRREYMRTYMQEYRKGVNVGKQRKTQLANAEVDAETEELDRALDKGGKRSALALEEYFNKFWTAYPRKTKKQDAWKAFLKIRNFDLIEDILSALEKHKKSRQWKDSQYIPHPATWINGKRWEDDLSHENNRPNTTSRNPNRNQGTCNEGKSSQYAGLGRL